MGFWFGWLLLFCLCAFLVVFCLFVVIGFFGGVLGVGFVLVWGFLLVLFGWLICFVFMGMGKLPCI